MLLSSGSCAALARGLLGALLVFSHGAPAPGTPLPWKRIEMMAERDGLHAGESMGVGVKASLARGFHVNSHLPSAEYLIPTSVEILSLDGLQSGDWKYPEGETKRFPFSEEPLKVYEGTFLIHGTLTAPADAPPSPRQVRVALRYQACTAERCYPPKKEEVILNVRVVSAESATRPLHPELFSTPPFSPP